ncbi:hypothetical protein B0I35DRAFT_483574 [Stachybotrys elegans]|uniref:SNF2 N-terminal domain-containing protein n=1 Tax=Stachybotrys elegans TaxID=80388 RepID=A0A8K0SGJ4_9HYPO|nr:hypothetical protein B0I35DRAFT_483574 [Stachybotrys elegans]
MAQAMALDRSMNSAHPPEKPDLEELIERFQFSGYKIDEAASREFKPHQIAHLGILADRFAAGQNVVFANDMGLGKTKVFVALVGARNRLLRHAMTSDPDTRFRPTIIINPPSTILQTFHEIKQHFSMLAPRVYYGTESSWSGPKAKVIRSGQLVSYTSSLDSSDPNTGRIVILTTFGTLRARELNKNETRFIIFNRLRKRARTGV